MAANFFCTASSVPDIFKEAEISVLCCAKTEKDQFVRAGESEKEENQLWMRNDLFLKLPKLPPNKKLEAIFLIVDDVPLQPVRRTPHADIAGKIKIKGDLLDTVPAEAWEFSP